MTAPAPRNHPAEDAHPAPTPAPVAVPVSSPGQCCRDGYCIEVGINEVHELTRDQADRVVDLLSTPRPEPVVASLPSEEVLRILDETREKFETASGESIWNRGAAHGLRVARAEIDRLVPEDDEDAGDVGVLHPLHEACGWQIGPMPDIKTNRDFCREQVAKHREACTGKPEDDEDTVRVPRSAGSEEDRETYSVTQIRKAFERHAGQDDWGVKAFYDVSLISALRGEYDEEPER